MNLLLLRCTPSYSILHSSTVSCFDRGPKISSPILRTAAPVLATTIPARDRVIDFGKYKGKMLGTLPSNYLNWVSKNLRARDFQEWAQLVDQVLNDPLYRDRIEWELAEKLLNGDVFCSSGSGSRADQNAVSELLEISERFGWDNEDKLGWSKIDFELLGTSKGGRIPRRVSEKGGVGREIREKRETSSRVCDGGSSRTRRMKRREKGRLKRSNGLQSQHLLMGGRTMSSTRREDKGRDSFEDGDDEVGLDLDLDGNQEIYKDGAATETHNRIIICNPFPGRRAFLKKVLLSRRSL